MRFACAFGGEGDAPGQFKDPFGVAVLRGLLVVSEGDGRWEAAAGAVPADVLTPKGVPLQVLAIFYSGAVRGLCASEQRVWVVAPHVQGVHVLTLTAVPQNIRSKTVNALIVLFGDTDKAS